MARRPLQNWRTFSANSRRQITFLSRNTITLLAFDLDPPLENAGDRRDLATERFDFLLANLPGGTDAINAASSNVDELKRAAHKLDDTVSYCEVSRLTKAIEKLE